MGLAHRLRPFSAPLTDDRGLTLLELVILLVIAAIALPGLMIYFIESMEHSAEAQVETVAVGLAQELMEEIKAKRWDENSPIPPGAYSAIGPDVETRCNPVICGATYYDDMDDYNGLNNSPPQGPYGANEVLNEFSAYRQLVTVCYVNEVDPVGGGNTVADGPCITGPTDYKLITVTIRWGVNEIQLQSVTANYQVDQS